MFTFRRAALIAVSILLIFLLFCGPKWDAPSKRQIELEKKLQQWERAQENALKELQQATESRENTQQEEINKLQAQRRMLEKQIQGLRRLPDSAGIIDQLKYQFPYRKQEKFPAYIWQTWKKHLTDPTLEEPIRENMESWRRLNSKFTHELLTDDYALKMIQHLYSNVPQVVQAYEAMPDPILRADFFRYLILLARGGVYTDADTEALKPIPMWIPSSVDLMTVGLVIGIEADPDRPDWHDYYARRIQFCQWTIQAKPGHPLLRSLVANITQQTLKRKAEGSLNLPQTSERGSYIMDWTGPGVWTDQIFTYLNESVAEPVTWNKFANLQDPIQIADVLTLPITAFSPGVGHMGSKPITDSEALVQHHFGGVWKND